MLLGPNTIYGYTFLNKEGNRVYKEGVFVTSEICVMTSVIETYLVFRPMNQNEPREAISLFEIQSICQVSESD